MDLTDVYIYSSKYKDMVIQISNQVTAVINLENLEKKQFSEHPCLCHRISYLYI